MTSNHLVIAAGGTGGHMFPAQALAEEMLRRGWRVTLSTDDRGARYASGFPKAVERKVIQSASPSQGGILKKLRAPFSLGAGVLDMVRFFKSETPDVVAGFGGYPAFPALAAAHLLKLPRLIHEQNGVPGRVNRLFAKHVDQFACGVWPTRLPDGTKAVHSGNPVRAEIYAAKAAPYPEMKGDLSLLVIGGSQGARILSHTVPEALLALPEALRARLHIAQQVRPEDMGFVEAKYHGSGLKPELKPFFDDIPQRMRRAHLVISRAGASSIADISVIGRPSILIPFAAAMDDHQTANAKGLVSADAALVIQEKDLTAEGLSRHIADILGTPERAAQMAQNALACSKPDAAQNLANLVENLKG